MVAGVGDEQRSAQQDDGRTANSAGALQTFGVLATRLNDALAQARAALAPHTALLPEGTLAGLDELLTEFARRRVRIAIYGEVKAGKSTLLNAIAGAVLSPAAFDPLTSIPVRVTYGPRTTWRVAGHQLDSVAELEQLMREGVTHPADAVPEVVVETDLDLLELGGQVDLLDTPGVGSAEQFNVVSAAALRSLDAVVLVVRYPALFTQYTRRLMDSLETDIGKLFVVWNLDADCAELTPEERTRHAQTLRANIAGAHELFLVDARAGFRAMQAEDGQGSVASGLSAFIAALRRFAASGEREVTALRQAAKRSQQSLTAAQQYLTERHTALDDHLKDTRTLLLAVQARADDEAAAARARLTELENTLARLAQEAAATAAKLAADYGRELRAARRRWIRRGDYQALETAVAAATGGYADRVEAANRATLDALCTEVERFGTTVTPAMRARSEPIDGSLAPEDRHQRATTGHLQLLRRALWHRWYLPGIATLLREAIISDLQSQAAWINAASETANEAAQTTLSSRLMDIAHRADSEADQIKAETNFVASEAEFERLDRDLPVVLAQVEAVTRLAANARPLL